MRRILPVALLLFAGVVSLMPLLEIVRRPTSTPRLIVEALAATITVIAMVWAGGALLWLIEQRWWTRRVPRVIVRSYPGSRRHHCACRRRCDVSRPRPSGSCSRTVDHAD